MRRSGRDQAAGLRRLLPSKILRVVPIGAGCEGIGKTSFVVNFAAAAQRQGQSVVVLDQSHGDIPAALGIRYRYELRHVLSGDKNFEDIMLRGPGRLRIFPAARGLEALFKAGRTGSGLLQAFGALDDPPDLIVINTPAQRAELACALGASADAGREIVLIVSDVPTTITATYAQIKSLARDRGQQQFRVLVNRAASEDFALRVYDNMAEAADRNLAVQIRYGGYIPRDPSLKRSRHAQQTVFNTDPHAESAFAFDRVAASVFDWRVPEFTHRPVEQATYAYNSQ